MPHLYQLVRSLTPAEKKYFKQYAKLYGASKSKYEKLFDALYKWEGEYDEAAFRKKYKGKIFIKNLVDEKSNLKELLLKILVPAFTAKLPEIPAWEYFSTIQFLTQKGLKEQAMQQIEKAMKIATEQEAFHAQLKLWDFIYSLNSLSAGNLTYTPAQIQQQEELLLANIKIHRRAIYLKNHFFQYADSDTYPHRKKETQEIIKETERFLKDERTPHIAGIYFSWIKLHYLFKEKRIAEAIRFGAKRLQLFEENAWEGAYSTNRYLVTASNILNVIFAGKKYEQVLPLLEKLKQQVIPKNPPEATELFFVLAHNEVQYLLETLPPNTVKWIEAIEKEMEKYKPLLGWRKELLIRINAAIALFYFKRQQDTLRLVRLIDDQFGRKSVNAEITLALYVLEFLSHAQNKNYVILDSHLRSMSRYLQSKELDAPFYRELKKVLASILKHHSLQAQPVQKALQSFHKTALPEDMTPHLKGVVHFAVMGKHLSD